MCGWGTPFQLNLCQLWIFLFKMVDNLGPNCQFTWKIMTPMTFLQPVVRPTRKFLHFSFRNGASKLSEQRWQTDFFWFTSPMVEFTSRLRRHLLDRDGSNRLGTWVERSCTGIKVCKNSLEFSCSSKVMTLRHGRKRQIEGTNENFKISMVECWALRLKGLQPPISTKMLGHWGCNWHEFLNACKIIGFKGPLCWNDSVNERNWRVD